jgi:hypothetical protein
MLANIANWEARVDEIAANATPATGNLGRALALQRDMAMCRLSLARLAGLDLDET